MIAQVQEVAVIGLQEVGVEQQLKTGLEQLLGVGVAAGFEQVLELGAGLGTLLVQVKEMGLRVGQVLELGVWFGLGQELEQVLARVQLQMEVLGLPHEEAGLGFV